MKAHNRQTYLMIFIFLLIMAVCAMARRTPASSTLQLLEPAGSAPNKEAFFINLLIECDQNTIVLANRALKDSSLSEVKVLAEEIRSSRQMEVQQLLEWRKLWYSDNRGKALQTSIPLNQISEDRSQPFDSRLLETLILRNNLITEIAEEAKDWTEHAELEALLDHLINTQQVEMDDMKQWQANWFGNSRQIASR